RDAILRSHDTTKGRTATMNDLILPPGFEFGVATSAFQIEGGWDEDGKGPAICDTSGHTPGKVFEDVPGDVACDSYHRYRDDIALMKWLGLDTYRLSLSWARHPPARHGRGGGRGP